MFERTLDFIEKASVEELQKELEAYGIEFIRNPRKMPILAKIFQYGAPKVRKLRIDMCQIIRKL